MILPEPRWFAVFTHPLAEHQAHRGIEEQAFPAFLPVREGWRRCFGHNEPLPLLSRYIFAFFAISPFPNTAGKRWQGIAYTRGVRRILGATWGMPVPVPRGVVEHLQARMEADGGAITFREPEQQRFKVGQKVQFLDGFIEGLVQEDEGARVKVLLDMLGKPHVIPVERESIAAVV